MKRSNQMGLGTFIIGAIVGAGATFFFLSREVEAAPPPEVQEPLEDTVSIFVDPLKINNTRWNFEATYRNRTQRTARTRVSFELLNPDNSQVFIQEQDLDIEPGSAIQIFWDSGDITNFTNQFGNFRAIFRVQELFTFISLARPFEVIFPIEQPSPMEIGI